MKMLQKSLSIILVIFLTLVQVVPVFAEQGNNEQLAEMDRIYYVDSTLGDDSADGNSESSPWKTLNRVNETIFLPGDAILFKADGIWEGALKPQGDGALDSRIIIGSYGEGNLPQIHGRGVENTIEFKNQQHWEIRDLEITNYVEGAPTPTTPRRGIYILGENVGAEELTETNLDNIEVLRDFYIHDLYIHDVLGQDKKDGDGSAAIQISVRIPDMINDQIPKDGSINQRTTFDSIRIENNIIKKIDRSGILFWSDWKSRDLLRDTDFVYGDKSKTPWTPMTNVHISGNKLYDIGGDGIAPHMTDGSIVEYNFIDGFNVRSTGYNAGMWLWNGDNALFQYNEATGGISTRDGMPWDFDQGTQGTIYQYNYSYNNAGGTLLFCTENADGGVKDGIFRYNLSYNDKYQIFTVCGGSKMQNVNVYNNVFYVGAGLNTKMMVSQGGGVEVGLYNNSFINLGSGGYALKPTWKYQFNAFSGNKIPIFNTIPDPFMVTEDPQFISMEFPGTVLDKPMDSRDIYDWSALDGFKIKETSPYVNGGRFISVDDPLHPGSGDMFRNELYNGSPDIGLHEFSDIEFEYVAPFIPVVPKAPIEIKNGDFEATTLHANGSPWNFQWNGAISKIDPFEGLYSGQIKATTGGASIEQTVPVDSGKSYIISAMTKAPNALGEIYLGVKWTSATLGNEEVKTLITHTEYSMSELSISIPDDVSAVTLFFYKAKGSADSSFIDNVKISLKSEEPDPEPEDLDASLLEFMILEAEEQVEDGALVGVIEDVVEGFNKALKEAKDMLAKVNADPTSVIQAEIDLATKNLIDMLHRLDFKGTKGKLQRLVDQCEEYVADKALYSKATYDLFNAALDEAKTVLADKTALQDEIDKAWFDLATGFAGLRKIPNKDALKELLNKARSIDSSQYTVASFARLADATDNANTVYNDINATEKAVVSSEKAVKTALAGLVPLVVTTTAGTDTDGTATTTKVSDSDKAIKVADTTTKAATSVPKTGENSLAMLLFILLSLSCVVTVVIRKKKVK